MSDKRQILVVDDSPNEIRVLMENLKSDFAVVAATSGELALETVRKHTPDLILLDVCMEPMDGYQTCSILQDEFPSVPVIFVSSNTKTEEILKGFEVGGRDYIAKPINPEVLASKIQLTLKQCDAKAQLTSDHTEASNLANSVMSSVGDMGVIHNFLRKGIKLNSEQSLADTIVETLNEYGLPASVEARQHDGNAFHASTSGEFAPLEKEILSSSVNIDGRLHQRGKSLIVMYDSISIFVKVMPIDNEQRVGELRDYLMMLVESAHDLNQKINADLTLASERVFKVLAVVKESEAAMQSIQEFQQKHKQDNINIMDELLKDVEKSYVDLFLTEDQENKISILIQDKINQALKHMEHGLKMDKKFEHLTEQLSSLTVAA